MREFMHSYRLGVTAIATMATLAACSDDGSPGLEPDTSAETDAPEAGDTAPDPDTGEAPPDGSLSVVLLEGVPTNLLLGSSAYIEFEVPEGTASVSISVVGSPGTMYALDSWSDAQPEQLVTSGWLNSQDGQGGLCLSCLNRITVIDGAFATLAPNNPSVAVRAGTHRFAVTGFQQPAVVTSGSAVCGDNICHFLDQFQCPQDCAPTPAAGTVEVWVHAKVTGDRRVPSSGVLDFNLHFTGAQGLTAESAQTDETFQAAMGTVRALYEQVDITIGEVNYVDIDARFATIEAFDGEDSDLMEMFELSAGNPMALNIFFVNELQAGAFGGFGMVLGISGGIPGPPLLQGSPRSGVAVALQPVDGAPAQLDTTIAHEVGHFLGLFHTSEQNLFGGPGIHDPIPDTPENDDRYLMFNTGAGSLISAQQGVVMRANPFVRHPTSRD